MVIDYLTCIFNDFSEYIDDGNSLCKLKNLHFDLEYWPDYDDVNIQQLYLLRYAYAYIFEYKNMFKVILQRDSKFLRKKKLRILSIGCGAGLDYIGARLALDEYGKGSGDITYTGIDCIDWNYRPDDKYDDSTNYITQSADEWFEEQDELNFDVLIFPKSICEFPKDVFKNICQSLERHNFNKNKLHLLVSLRNTDGVIGLDMRRTKKIVRAMSNNGYDTTDDTESPISFGDKDRGIKSYDSSFDYPNDARDLLKDLNKYCINYDNGRNCSNDCFKRLVRWPILKPTTIAYQVITFKEKE